MYLCKILRLINSLIRLLVVTGGLIGSLKTSGHKYSIILRSTYHILFLLNRSLIPRSTLFKYLLLYGVKESWAISYSLKEAAAQHAQLVIPNEKD